MKQILSKYIALFLAFVAAIVEAAQDRLNGDVESVVSGLRKTEARLSRAAQVAQRKSAAAMARADHYDALADAAEEEAEALDAAAERAIRVRARVSALLD